MKMGYVFISPPIGGRGDNVSRPRSSPAWRLVSSPSACRSDDNRDGVLRFGLVSRVRVCQLWCAVGVVGSPVERINLGQLYSHAGVDLHDGVLELMALCACRYFRSAAWSSRLSSDLPRSVSRYVVAVYRFPRRRWEHGWGGYSRAWRWWIFIIIPRLRRWDAVDLDPR
jgi:hypothetical protein